MPGIVGIISKRSAQECEGLVNAMLATLQHEWHHGCGRVFSPKLGIYAGWVADRDSFAFNQSGIAERANISLVFAGECFIDQSSPHHRRPHANAQQRWITQLYNERGDAFVETLNGLFSGLLVDEREEKVLLFNDRYGMERIYWHEANGDFFFATEAKALLRILPELREFDHEGVTQFLTFGCTITPQTLFRGINLLPGGSLFCFQNHTCHKKRYFSPIAWEQRPPLSRDAFAEEFDQTFKRILPRYLDSDGKIGISLTGGLDTRMIMASLPATVEELTCYTFSGQEGLTFDDRLSARVAAACGLDHTLLRVGSDFLSDFAEYADKTVYITDGCFGVVGAHEIYLNKKARQLAPIRLTGNYGSEILRDVSTFKPNPVSSELISPAISRAIENQIREFEADRLHPTTFAAFHNVPLNLFGSFAAARSQVGWRTPYLDNEIVALAYQIPASMRGSQVPSLRFVKRNSRALSEIPTDKGFASNLSVPHEIARRCLARLTFKLDYFYDDGMPHWLSPFEPVVGRLGYGLGVLGLHKYLHYRSWFRRKLIDYLRDALTDTRTTRQNEFWNTSFLQRMFGQHTGGFKNYLTEINAVLTLQTVERLLFRDLPRGPDTSKVTTRILAEARS